MKIKDVIFADVTRSTASPTPAQKQYPYSVKKLCKLIL